MKHLATPLIVLIVSAIPLIVLGLNLYALYHWIEIRNLETSGVAAEAVVLSRESSELTRNNTYRITLRYDVKSHDGHTKALTTEAVVDESLFRRSVVGAKLPVYYAFSHPARVHVRGNQIFIKHILYALVGDVLLAIAIVAVIRIARKEKLHAAKVANATRA